MKKGEGSFGGSGYFEVGRFRRMEFKTLSPFSSFHFLLSSTNCPFSFFIAAILPSTTLDLLLQVPWTRSPVPTSRLSHAVIFREERPVTRLAMPSFLSCLLSASLCWRCTDRGGWEVGIFLGVRNTAISIFTRHHVFLHLVLLHSFMFVLFSSWQAQRGCQNEERHSLYLPT